MITDFSQAVKKAMNEPKAPSELVERTAALARQASERFKAQQKAAEKTRSEDVPGLVH